MQAHHKTTATYYLQTKDNALYRYFDTRQEMIDAYNHENEYWRRELNFTANVYIDDFNNPNVSTDDLYLRTLDHRQIIRDHRAAVIRRLRKMRDNGISEYQHNHIVDEIKNAARCTCGEILKWAE